MKKKIKYFSILIFKTSKLKCRLTCSETLINKYFSLLNFKNYVIYSIFSTYCSSYIMVDR